MWRKFDSLAALAAHLEGVAARIPSQEHKWLQQIGQHVEHKAKSKIGHYQPGWPPLAQTTLEGWRGHPGKIALGYAPPDNPLLRTGQMRDSIGHSVGAKEVHVGAGDSKAKFHELGTSKMPPRPFIGPAMKEEMPHNIQIIGAGIAETFRST